MASIRLWIHSETIRVYDVQLKGFLNAQERHLLKFKAFTSSRVIHLTRILVESNSLTAGAPKQPMAGD